ncbi:3-carboxy-cis,cis-muconate cycloisomerase [Lentzea sp. NBRC 105346]|uniref:3-carboxy-cis,cis-muconate cycloisomerase n=1 Tax=Lentzea sp. NBRC 105346 TaxID=3032205 RepID=UPI0024A38494|nr:3-carboxy-cis,cis-muconate cycloisomerase [Lentzea sp. NBRC 105346]GLZ35012.1 3-carboxy-cis,cis-muconate cycloisomerase [Lentzea sp. NBRC 105346]
MAEIDSGILAPTWAGTPVEREVDDRAWLRAMVDVEGALARAQARLGVIPAAAAEAISAVDPARLDLVDLAHRSRAAANPVVAFVPALTALLPPEAAEYVHRGSTSQDILDTATMLVVSRALSLVTGDLHRVADALATLASEHRDTVVAGRTLTQHAVPTTFGLKAAGWLQLVLDALDRIDALVLPACLGGAAGTMAAYAEYGALEGLDGGLPLLEPFAGELGLAVPVLPWHTLRTPIVDVAAVLQFVSGALGKLAVDVQVLSRTEIGEVAEPAAEGRGASSAMPQKRNPVLATLILTAARQVPALTSVLAQSMVAEDERPAGAWHAEWQPLREALRLVGGAAHTAAELAEGLEVYPARMASNVDMGQGAIVSERLNVALAPVLGKANAKKLLGAVTAEAARTGKPLREVLAEHVDVPLPLDDLLDPARYLGAAGALVDRALDRYRKRS